MPYAAPKDGNLAGWDPAVYRVQGGRDDAEEDYGALSRSPISATPSAPEQTIVIAGLQGDSSKRPR